MDPLMQEQHGLKGIRAVGQFFGKGPACHRDFDFTHAVSAVMEWLSRRAKRTRAGASNGPHGKRAMGSGIDQAVGHSTANQLGSSLIEMALVMPVFFLLLFGLFECSMVFFTFCNANYAVRIAARYASVHSSTAFIPCTTTAVQNMIAANIYLPASQTYLPVVTGCPGTIGSNVTVSVTWSQKLYLPGFTTSTFDVGGRTKRTITR